MQINFKKSQENDDSDTPYDYTNEEPLEDDADYENEDRYEYEENDTDYCD